LKFLSIHICSDSTLVKAGVWSKTTAIHRAGKGDELAVCLLSLSWVGLDICSTFTPKYAGKTYQEYRQQLQLQEQAQETLFGSAESSSGK